MKAVFDRINSVTGCRTMTELAAFFASSVAVVSDARRRGNIPDYWLNILSSKGIDVEWVLTGVGPVPDTRSGSGLNNAC